MVIFTVVCTADYSLNKFWILLNAECNIKPETHLIYEVFKVLFLRKNNRHICSQLAVDLNYDGFGDKVRMVEDKIEE